MINPQDLDLSSLPWLPLEDVSAFPKRASIYFAIDSSGKVQYIGRTINTCNRWRQHHKFDVLDSIGGIKIAYLFIDTHELLPEIEKALIHWFKPSLNILDNRLAQEKPANIEDDDIIKARDKGIVTLRVFVTPEERDAIQDRCKKEGISMAHALRLLALNWTKD